MTTLLSILKYTFVIGVGVELVLIGRALVRLAREKSRAAAPQAAPAEE